MTTPNWSIMWMQRMELSWRDICSRGPVMPLKHGTGLCVQLQELLDFSILYKNITKIIGADLCFC